MKHLETAPKEILGDFPRLSRERAILMINNTATALAQGQDTTNQKIPSLFDLNVPAPTNTLDKNENKDGKGEYIYRYTYMTNAESGSNVNILIIIVEETSNQQKSTVRERKPSGKKTRWGSDEDRVPYEQIMLLQSANELGIQLPNAALGLATQQQLQQSQVLQPCVPSMDFYTETNAESSKTTVNKFREDFTKDLEEDEILAQVRYKMSDISLIYTITIHSI